MTEEQKFDLIRVIPGTKVEIRWYHECSVAEVLVKADYQNAGNIGFRPLVTYISRSNIAMTAPVIQQPFNDAWVVAFVMPAGMGIEDLPIPSDSKVVLRQIPEHLAAAITFSGVTNETRVKKMESELRTALRNENLATTGEIQIARFDPPWKPGFMRKNEVILKLANQN